LAIPASGFGGLCQRQRRAFRAADGGVLFLDEIAELPLELQPMLLDVLERREVKLVGSTRQVPIDVHVIAATNRNLQTEVAEGRFREDLLFRLTTVALEVPPLRDRPDDIPRFIARFSARYDQPRSRQSINGQSIVRRQGQRNHGDGTRCRVLPRTLPSTHA